MRPPNAIACHVGSGWVIVTSPLDRRCVLMWGGEQLVSSEGFAPERFDHQTQEFFALVFLR